MSTKLNTVVCLVVVLLMSSAVFAQSVDYVGPQPLSEVVNTYARPVSSGTVKIPLITWGGDVATILAKQNGVFKQEGLNVSLFREDNFAKQVDMCLSGETPYLRGTMGMINAASEAVKKSGTELVVIYQMTWSTGGDAMVVRQGKNIKNIRKVALQRYGPHMDYAANLFASAGRLNQVEFKWLNELTLPTFDSPKIIDPVSAFEADQTIDAVMCILPDALMLTSDGTVGTGSEGSVKGASILLSTKTASRIIADVYAVRKDYLDANRSQVQAFVHALMRGEEQLRDLLKNKSTQQSQYTKLLSESASTLLGASQATADVEGMVADCEFVGYTGNVSFFTGKGTTRNLKSLTSEIQSSFIAMKMMNRAGTIASASWDYNALAKGLKYATNVPAAKPKYDANKVAAKVAEKIAVEAESWEEEGTLFIVEIGFAPNQENFSSNQYASDFQKAVEIAQTYNGALIIIEGHSDPLAILKAEKKGESQAVINQMKQKAKNLSYRRGQAVRDSFLKYCAQKNLVVDESQFVAIGLGATMPKYNPPRTEAEWNANRRVVFRIKQMEAELSGFEPL